MIVRLWVCHLVLLDIPAAVRASVEVRLPIGLLSTNRSGLRIVCEIKRLGAFHLKAVAGAGLQHHAACCIHRLRTRNPKYAVGLRIESIKTCVWRRGRRAGNELCGVENEAGENRRCNADAKVRSHVNLASLIWSPWEKQECDMSATGRAR